MTHHHIMTWKDQMDNLMGLPTEIIVDILSLLTPQDLCNLSETCRYWRNFINFSDYLWKHICLELCPVDDIIVDIQHGFSWKETVMRNYGKKGIEKKWLQGQFSSPASFEELPNNHMCKLEADTWGDILQLELTR